MKKLFLLSLLVFSMSAFSLIPQNGLFCYLPFNGNANDQSGNGFHGLIHGATTTTDRFGNANNALSFDGINDYVDLKQYKTFISNKTPLSVSFWVKTASDNAQAIFSQLDSTVNDRGGIIYLGDNVTGTMENELVVVTNRGSNTGNYTTGFSSTNRSMLINNQWHHIVLVFDGLFSWLYLDNQLLPYDYYNSTGFFADFGVSNNIVIGARFYSPTGLGAFLNGSLDDFLMYDRAITSSEVRSLYTDVATGVNNHSFANNVEIKALAAKRCILIESEDFTQTNKVIISDLVGRIIYQDKITTNRFEIFLSQTTVNSVYFVQVIDEDGNRMGLSKVFF